MSGVGAPLRSILEVGWAGRALAEAEHGAESGDLHAVVSFDGGALVAVIDGLGHGTEAARASQAAVEVLQTRPSAAVLDLVHECHEALRKTRGAVLTLCQFHAVHSTLVWTAVGNVEGELLRRDRTGERRREVIAGRGGVVGCRLPPLKATELEVERGDTLILVTDGIRSRFAVDLPLERSPQELADVVLERHAKPSDDALVLVARYLGEAGP